MNRKFKSHFLRLLGDQGGAVSLVAALWIGSVGVALTGVAINVNDLFRVQRALQASSDAAAAAAAQQINVQTLAELTDTALDFSSATIGSPKGVNPIAGVAVSAKVTTGCLSSLLPPVNGKPEPTGTACPNTTMYGSPGVNYLQVTQTATVPLFFGVAAKTLTATAVATGSGGLTKPLNIMLILDSTQSMGTADSTGCTPPGIKNPTRFQCMEYGAQVLLQGLLPVADYVGVMTFPGLLTTGTGSGKGGNGIPTLTTLQGYEYCVSTGAIASGDMAEYKASPAPAYEIIPSTLTGSPTVPMSNDYKTSDTATSLNASSKLVKLLGPPNSCKGLQLVGGKGTYYAEAITAAQTYLTAYGSKIGSGRANAQNVIILLSDGDASSTGSSIVAAYDKNECQQGVTAAQAAAKAGTWVYTVAYGSQTSGSCSTDKGLQACTAMQEMASSPGAIPDSSKFYSDTKQSGGTGSGCKSQNNVAEMGQIFGAIALSLTPARLLSASCVTSDTCTITTP